MGTVICCLGVTTAADKSETSSSAYRPPLALEEKFPTAYSLKAQCGVEKRVYTTIVFLILAWSS